MASAVKKRRGRPPIKKEEVCEDYCFTCKDGGYLLVCDYKNCLKAYHPECVGKVENELEPEKRWNCSWHKCLICNRNSAFRCFGCPSAVCKRCVEYAEFVLVKNNKGFCANCLRLALLIEENVDVDSDGEKIDFKDRNTFETLFKEYWEIVKEQEGLTLEELHSADIKLKKGLGYKNDCDSDPINEGEEDRDFVYEMDGNLDTEIFSFLGKELKPLSTGKHSRKGKPKKREFDGWGSKALRNFLKSIGKDSNDAISQNEVNVIIQKYVQENKLTHPEKKKKILCDTKLQSVFGRKSVNRNKTYDLLEQHFADNIEESDENDWSYSSDEMVEGTTMSCKKQRKTSLSKNVVEKENVKETRRSGFASVTAQNIKLIYLKRSLIQEFSKNPESFDEKVMGCFVRVRSDPHDFFQKNPYQLVQVTGVTRAQGNGNIKEEVNLHVSNSKNTFRIGTLSNEDFLEEEIEDLQRRVKDGLLQKLNIVDLERKAHSLHEDLTNHWIDRELIRLQHLSDRANEKGWRAELYEYMERRQLLQTPAERRRLIEEFPQVIAEEIEVEATPPSDLPVDENPEIDYSLDPGSISIVRGTKDVNCAAAVIKDVQDVTVIDANGHGGSDRKSAKKVEDFSWVEVKRNYLDQRPAATVTEGVEDVICVDSAMEALPDLCRTEINLDTANFRGSEKTEFELTVRGFMQNDNAGYAYSLVPRLGGSQAQTTGTGDRGAAKKEIEGVPLAVPNGIEKENSGTQISIHVNVENDEEQIIILDDNEGGQVKVEHNEDRRLVVLPNNETIKHSNETVSAEVVDLDAEVVDLDLESKIWHYMDPYDEVHGPFPLFKLKEWWDAEHFTVVPDFKVWKVGQSKEEAVLLKDVLARGFPGFIPKDQDSL